MVAKKTFSVTVVFFLIACGLWISSVQADDRPSVLVIVSDDQPFGTVTTAMPHTLSKIFEEGAAFTSGYISTPSCCPSRASIFTGMYASRHGVKVNRLPLSRLTLAHWLKDEGYQTALVGKYLNSWPGTPRSEYDYWVSFKGGSVRYVDPPLNVQGEWRKDKGNVTELLGGYAREFLEQAVENPEPFFLMFTPNAPHRPITPAPDTQLLFAHSKPVRNPSFNPLRKRGMARWLRGVPRLKPLRINRTDEYRLDQLRALITLDEQVMQLMDFLESKGRLDSTLVIYISDNGYLFGEHGLVGKDSPYEEAVHVPFAMRYPPRIPEAKVVTRLVSNIDIAPTIFDALGLEPPEEIDGRSLFDALDPEVEWRSSLLLEGWKNRIRARRAFKALHIGSHVYIRYKRDRDECYDLLNDPFQQRNIVRDFAERELVESLRSQLEAEISVDRQ